MDEYFNPTLNKLKLNSFNDLTIVLGNESCDLDSAVSSLVYAVFLAWQHQQIQCKVCTRPGGRERDDIFVSILNVDKDDFLLKTEVVSQLRESGVDADKLIFRNDLDLNQLVIDKRVKVVLVDHHTLADRDKFLAPYVTEIIDHRPIDKTAWNYKDDTRSTIEIVGSCCTLVAQRVKDLSVLMAKNVEFFHTYPALTNMLHSTIILDTVNFSKELDKATPQDLEIVKFLETLLKIEDFEAERKRKLDRLSQAKSDVSSLTAAQLLKKDVKIFGTILVPSFPILIEEYLQKPKSIEAISEALVLRGCEVAVLLGIDYKEAMKRDTAIYSGQPLTAEQLGTFLENWTSPPLQLIPHPAPGAAPCRYYKQLNLTATRKQYIPALNQYLSNK